MSYSRVEVLYNKAKMKRGLLLVASTPIIMTVLTLWVNSIAKEPNYRPWYIIIPMYFFIGFLVYRINKRIANDKPAYIIDETGITDNNEPMAVGHIPWQDVERVEALNTGETTQLIIIVKHPTDYINRQQNSSTRKAMESRLKNNGSPIFLQVDKFILTTPDELKNHIETGLAQSRGRYA